MAQLILAHPPPKVEMSVNQIKVFGSQPEPHLGLDFCQATSKWKISRVKPLRNPEVRVGMNGVTFPATTEKRRPGEDATSATSLDRKGRHQAELLGVFIINLKTEVVLNILENKSKPNLPPPLGFCIEDILLCAHRRRYQELPWPERQCLEQQRQDQHGSGRTAPF